MSALRIEFGALAPSLRRAAREDQPGADHRLRQSAAAGLGAVQLFRGGLPA